MSNEDLFKFEEKDKISEQLHDFSINHEVVGILREIKDGSFGKVFVVETKDKKLVTVGSYTTLIHKINSEALNKPIKIVFKGINRGKNSKFNYYDFDVFIKK